MDYVMSNSFAVEKFETLRTLFVLYLKRTRLYECMNERYSFKGTVAGAVRLVKLRKHRRRVEKRRCLSRVQWESPEAPGVRDVNRWLCNSSAWGRRQMYTTRDETRLHYTHICLMDMDQVFRVDVRVESSRVEWSVSINSAADRRQQVARAGHLKAGNTSRAPEMRRRLANFEWSAMRWSAICYSKMCFAQK